MRSTAVLISAAQAEKSRRIKGLTQDPHSKQVTQKESALKSPDSKFIPVPSPSDQGDSWTSALTLKNLINNHFRQS